MATTIQARLDKKSQEALKRLLRRKDASTSEIVRESLVALDQQTEAAAPPKMIGIGCFASGLPDLATNKKYMEGLGAKSMGKGWLPPDKRAQ